MFQVWLLTWKTDDEHGIRCVGNAKDLGGFLSSLKDLKEEDFTPKQ